ncbi:MAG: sigma-54-dependent Fis family transcriptional regulator [bacterium]|nr:sigma-54-dependent Fis family transcriptional regulator [bacterium]
MKDIFSTLYEVGQILNSVLDPDELLNKMIDLVIEHTEAERGFIIAVDGLRIARNMEQESVEECFSTTVVQKIYETKKPVFTIDAQVDPRFRGSESILKGKVRSVCAVPLIHRGTIEGVIYVDSSLKQGVFDDATLRFLELFSNIASVALVNAIRFSKLKKEHEALKLKGFGELIGVSKPMQAVFDLIKKASSTSCPVFIQGESGTGKELVARAIHSNGTRAVYEFVPLYCGGLPESLIESELFGYKKGAFTGADKDKEGLFEAADRGTLFLDEICDIPLVIQAKLLRALQLGEIRRIGDTKLIKVDVRIISATNKDPRVEIKEKRFREDLYYRLNVLEIKLPPLRERKEDISLLTHYFLGKYGKSHGKEGFTFSKQAIEKLERNAWYGNVRELENFVQRTLVTVNENPIPPEAIVFAESHEYEPTLSELEREAVLNRLCAYRGDKMKAAKSLDISLRTLYYKLKEWRKV